MINPVTPLHSFTDRMIKLWEDSTEIIYQTQAAAETDFETKSNSYIAKFPYFHVYNLQII